MTITLETTDIQGLVVRGYGTLKYASFLLLRVKAAAPARAFLRSISDGDITHAHDSPPKRAIQIALTKPGLETLGLPDRILKTFSREFLEGMHDDVRAESLGDRGDNDPKHWTWGPNIHAMLMLYATEDTFADELGKLRARFAAGFDEVIEKTTHTLEQFKEHFGWRDGLSMPKFLGIPKKDQEQAKKTKPQWWDKTALAAGEFVLGYENEYEAYTESPTVDVDDDPDGILHHTPDRAKKDLGKNGTYLVYREMTQDVPTFWAYMKTSSHEPGDDPEASAIALGAKIVGRWPGGAPLMTSATDEPNRAEDNKFRYATDVANVSTADKFGATCPIGSHIRRANPRDHLAMDRDAADSTIMVRKHQMIRRGRAFGEPFDEHLDPRKMMAKAPDGKPRGLHFICLVGHISRQFEFVQRTWINSANFQGLFKDGDPIAAARRKDGVDPNPNDQFTCPAEPVRRKYTGMKPFTQLVGGAYFFLPSIRALKFIAREP